MIITTPTTQDDRQTRHRLCFVAMSFLFLFSTSVLACDNAPPCTEVEIDCALIPGHVKLVDLSPEELEKLKSELRPTLKEELRAELKREFELAQITAAKTLKPEENVAPKPEKAAAPKAAVAALPPTQKIERDAGGMKILRHLLTTSIVHRLPTDERESFAVEDSSVYCFVEISAADFEDRMITIKFTHSTGLSQSYSLPVSQSPAWRTWSKLNLTKSMTGRWLCEVFNEDNVLLSSSPFVVVD